MGRDGITLWDFNGNWKQDDGDVYEPSEFSDDIANCTACRVFAVMDQCFSSLFLPIATDGNHRNVAIYTAAGRNEPSWSRQYMRQWERNNPATTSIADMHKDVVDNGGLRSAPGSAEGTPGLGNNSICDCCALPSAVVLRFFAAVRYDDGVVIEWDTAVEVGNTGFNLYRSTGKNIERHKLNSDLIAARGDDLKGASYSYTDTDVTEGITYYWLEDVDLHGKATLHGPISARQPGLEKRPTVFSLAQNNPNPFSQATEITYGLPVASYVRLTVYDLRGRRVRTLVDGDEPAGYRVVQWDGRNDAGLEVSGGVYFYVLKAGGHSEVRKMTRLK